MLHRKRLEHQKKLLLLRQQAQREWREIELTHGNEQWNYQWPKKKRDEVLKQLQKQLEKVMAEREEKRQVGRPSKRSRG